MKLLITLFFISIISFSTVAQKSPIKGLKGKDYAFLKAKEDTLADLAMKIMIDSNAMTRLESNYKFIPTLVSALKVKNSFAYPWDSVLGVNIQVSPDNRFKIFSWHLAKEAGTFRHYGVIQMNNKKTLELIPLYDVSDTFSVSPQYGELEANNWYGCVYYKIMHHKVKGQDYYTLLGFDQNDFWSNKKFMEVMYFDENNKPHFGAPLIHFDLAPGLSVDVNRFFVEYKHNAVVSMNWNPLKEMVVFDHVEPEDPKTEGLFFTYVPDGTYEGFQWDDEKWVWVEKVFHFAINENDSPPMPNPVLERE